MKKKLIVLTLISGLFGWGWIIASLATVYFFVMAIGFDGEWSSFFWAFGAGAIAKWLAIGFESNTQRVAMEMQTDTEIQSAKSKNEGHWVRIVINFGKYLEENSTVDEIRDVSDLPYPKKEILDALCSEIVAEGDEGRRSALEVVALSLADFQEGVGPEPLRSLGVPVEQLLDSIRSGGSVVDAAKNISENPNKEKYEIFQAMVIEDMKIIEARLLVAKQGHSHEST